MTALLAFSACSDEIARLDAAARIADATHSVPTGFVKDALQQIELSNAAWLTSRLGALEGLQDLVELLRGEDNADLHGIANRIDRLIHDFPGQLAVSLRTLRGVISAGDEIELAKTENSVMVQLQAAQSFLADNRTALANCEENPWRLEVPIIEPTGSAIAKIEAAVSAL